MRLFCLPFSFELWYDCIMLNATAKNNMVTIARNEYETLKDFYEEYKSRVALKRIQEAETDFLAGRTKIFSSKKFLNNVKKWIAQ